jgi:CxxC motif-containing protein (DUF1111 family)
MNRQLFTISLLLPASLVLASCASEDTAQTDDNTAVSEAAQPEATGPGVNAITEAPAGFDNESNGFLGDAEFDEALDTFDEFELIADGLGPVYNTQSCRECHQNPVSGAGSQIGELRAGHFNGVSFVDAAGGSLINDRAINAAIQERVPGGNEVRTFRITLSVLGDGFVEAIDSNTLAAISAAQPAGQRGTFIQVPVGEAGGAVRGGRFGWKNQNSSLLSFSADAYLNEMGITSTLQPTENTSLGRSVAAFDTVADPEDDTDAAHPFGIDVQGFTDFMRATKAPPRDAAVAATAASQRGSALFDSIGCAVCHVRNINTVPAGTLINQGAFRVPAALGDKRIHPFGDFLLHDVGTGDGIVQNGGQGTRNQVRTAPLWGMRARGRLMHDGLSVTRTDAILRHANQAATARNNFAALSAASQNDLITFLNSL